MEVDDDSVFGDLEDQCTCWVCFEIFVDPTTLRCGHSFCKECVDKVFKKSPSCPFCRKPFGEPLPGVNPDVAALVDKYLNKKNKKDQRMDEVVVEQNSHFLTLPRETICEILQFLPPKQIGRTAKICRRMRTVTDDSWMWRGICQREFPFCSVDRYGKNWKWCYIGRSNIKAGWEEGKASQFNMTALRGHKNYVNCFRLYRNNIVSGSGDNTLKVWKVDSEDPLMTLVGHNGLINSVQFNEVKIVSGGEDNQAKIWDTKTGLTIKSLAHQSPVKMLQFDDTKILTCSADGIRVFDIRDGSPVKQFAQAGGVGPFGVVNTILQMEFDNKYVVTRGPQEVKVWDIASGNLVQDLNDNTAQIFQMISGQNKVITGSSTGEIRIHDVASGHSESIGPAAGSKTTDLKTDGKHVAIGLANGTVQYWDLVNKKLVYTFNEHKQEINSLQFSENKIVSGSADNSIRVCDLKKGKKLYALLGGSLQKRANNPDHPTKQGCTHLEFDDSRIVASYASLLRVYDFEVFKQS